MRLVENFSVHSKSMKEIPLQEKILESNGVKLIAKRKFSCPISRYDYENLNGRIYSKKLWEKVIKEQKGIWEGCVSLADHPSGDNDGSVKDIVGVWNNLRFGEGKDNLVYSDITFVGDLGQKAIEVMEAGGKVGFSSSGFGDLKENSKYIDESTYQIERISDWVLTPSQEVYGYIDDEIKESVKEDIVKEDKNILKETSTNIVEQKEFKEKAYMQTDIEKKNFRMGVSNLKKNALVETDLSKKLGLFREIVEYTTGIEEGKDHLEEAQKEISKIEESILALAEKGKKLDETNSKVEELSKEKNQISETLEVKEANITKLSEKYDIAKGMLEDAKIREKAIKQMYEISIAEKNGMIDPKDYVKLNEYSESLEEKLSVIENEMNKLKKQNIILKKKLEAEKDDDDEDEDEDKNKKEERAMYLRLKNKFEGKKKENEDEGDEEDEVEEKCSKKESMNFRNDKEVFEYYTDILKKNPNVKKIKEEILKRKTVKEAQRTYMNLKDLIDDDKINRYEDLKLHEKTDDIVPISKFEPSIDNILRKGWN